jgi:PAS domain S-box-containing protein
MEEAAKTPAAESEFLRFVDAIPGLVAALTPSGEVDFVNHQLSEYFGQTLEDLRHWGTNGTVHPEDLQFVADKFGASIALGTPYEITQRLRRSDGIYRWIQNRGFPLRDSTGTITRWCVLLTDVDERKHTEDALRESERQFKTIFDEAGAGISLVDLRSDAPIRNNRALQKMLERSEDDLGRFETYDELTFEADREKDSISFRELCRGERDSIKIEKHFVLKDGSSLYANVIFTLLRDDNGCPHYIIAIHEDITERKVAIEKLQANQELLDLAQKSAGAMAFDWYIQEDINYWSPEQEALFGLAPGTFDGTYKTWKNMMYKPDWPTVVAAIQHAHETGTVEAEYRVVWPDGSLHWLATNGRIFFDDAGEPLRMVGFTSDVTRRKLVEEDLKRSEAFLAESQQLARMGSYSWRREADEITWSEHLYRIYEIEQGTKITPDVVRTRVHPDDASLYEKMVEHAQGGDDYFEWQYRLLMPNGSIKYLNAVARARLDNNDQLEYIAAVQDITARKTAQESLDKARAELAHAAGVLSLGTLTASIAHEVNQPLSGIVTNASTCVRMLDANPPNVDGARETARRTIRDGKRASDVITRLRALFSKKDSTAEALDLNEVAEEVIVLSRSELQRNEVVLQTEFAADLPLVDGDRVQLQQVILNLLLNGSDAMNGIEDQPRQLTLITEADGNGSVLLHVRDIGIGFEPAEAEKLFDAFYTTKETGMGIGLSVSRSIIEGHQGRLWAEPNEGRGSVFSFSIPAHRKLATEELKPRRY